MEDGPCKTSVHKLVSCPVVQNHRNVRGSLVRRRKHPNELGEMVLENEHVPARVFSEQGGGGEPGTSQVTKSKADTETSASHTHL